MRVVDVQDHLSRPHDEHAQGVESSIKAFLERTPNGVQLRNLAFSIRERLVLPYEPAQLDTFTTHAGHADTSVTQGNEGGSSVAPSVPAQAQACMPAQQARATPHDLKPHSHVGDSTTGDQNDGLEAGLQSAREPEVLLRSLQASIVRCCASHKLRRLQRDIAI
jgi:hypothetical protein